jgi:hypothetical protein
VGKRSTHKRAKERRETHVQDAITTLSQYDWDVTLQDGKVGKEGEEQDVVRVLLISPWQPKELLSHPTHGLMPESAQ